MLKLPAIWGVIGIILISTADGNVLFEDDFDTNDEWATLFGPVDEEIIDGHYVVEKNGNGFGVQKHSAVFSTFDYEVSLKPLSNNIWTTGVMFCWNDASGGYEFTINSLQSFTLKKYVLGNDGIYHPEIMTTGYSSFIGQSEENILAVSKKNGQIILACNDVLIFEGTDQSFESGEIGLIVYGGSKISFDYVRVTDEESQAYQKDFFSDNFNDGDLLGWRKYNTSGHLENTGNTLLLRGAENASRTLVYTDGKYRNAPVKVIVNREDGPADAFYGLALLSLEMERVNDTSWRHNQSGVYFQISGSRRYGVGKSSFFPATSSHIHGTTDTLEITKEYRFVVNGDTLPGTDFGEDLDFNAVGLVVDAGVTVSFDDFTAGEQNNTPIVNSYRNNGILPASNSPRRPSGVVLDARGRIVASVNRSNFSRVIKNLGTGTFFVIYGKAGQPLSVKKTTIVR